MIFNLPKENSRNRSVTEENCREIPNHACPGVVSYLTRNAVKNHTSPRGPLRSQGGCKLNRVVYAATGARLYRSFVFDYSDPAGTRGQNRDHRPHQFLCWCMLPHSPKNLCGLGSTRIPCRRFGDMDLSGLVWTAP